MTPALMFLLDLVAIAVMAFLIYFPRHHRKDMVVAFFGVWGLMAAFDHAVLGFISGIAAGIWAIISSIGLFIGALIGGAIAPNRAHI